MNFGVEAKPQPRTGGAPEEPQKDPDRLSEKASVHTGKSRHRRGSLTRTIGSSPNSCRKRAASSWAAAERTGGERKQSSRSGRGSSQRDFNCSSSLSCHATIRVFSKKPLLLSSAGGSRSPGIATPRRLSVPDTAEVPLRCMPGNKNDYLSCRRGGFVRLPAFWANEHYIHRTNPSLQRGNILRSGVTGSLGRGTTLHGFCEIPS